MILNTLPRGLGLITCRKWTWKVLVFRCHRLTGGTARVSTRGTQAAEWDKKTWAPLLDLALNRPESGVHLQGSQNFAPTFYTRWTANNMKECEIYSRVKDKGSATAGWFAELLSPAPWFKDVVPNVGGHVFPWCR